MSFNHFNAGFAPALLDASMTRPVLLHALFSVRDPFHGALSFKANNDRQLTLSVLHERADGTIASYDLAGNEELIGMEACDAEALVVLARRSGAIIASAIFEVDTSLIDLGALLIPRVLSNLLFSQEAAPVQRYTAPLAAPAEVEAQP